MAAPYKFMSNINNYTSKKIKDLSRLLNLDLRRSFKNIGVCHIQNKQRQLKDLHTLQVKVVEAEAAEARAGMDDDYLVFMQSSDSCIKFGDVILNACFVLSVRSGIIIDEKGF